MPTIYVIDGPPGAGKSVLAQDLNLFKASILHLHRHQPATTARRVEDQVHAWQVAAEVSKRQVSSLLAVECQYPEDGLAIVQALRERLGPTTSGGSTITIRHVSIQTPE